MTDYAREVLERAYVDALRQHANRVEQLEEAKKALADCEMNLANNNRRRVELIVALQNRFGLDGPAMEELQKRAA